MSEPKEDPIEELFNVIRALETHGSIVINADYVSKHVLNAKTAIRALQERVKLLEFELTESNRLLLLDLKQINALRAKIKRLMEAGKHAIENIASFEAREAWRKAVSE